MRVVDEEVIDGLVVDLVDRNDNAESLGTSLGGIRSRLSDGKELVESTVVHSRIFRSSLLYLGVGCCMSLSGSSAI